MLSNNSIISVFSKEPLIAKDGHSYGFRCNISQSFAKKNEKGEVLLDENGKRTYVKDFTGSVKFLGDASTFISNVECSKEHPARIRVDNMGVKTLIYDKEVNGEMKKQYYTDVVVFKASALDNNNKPANKENSQYTPDDELPFM